LPKKLAMLAMPFAAAAFLEAGFGLASFATAAAAAAAGALDQGLTLVHFSAQRKRSQRVRGAFWGCQGRLGCVRGY